MTYLKFRYIDLGLELGPSIRTNLFRLIGCRAFWTIIIFSLGTKLFKREHDLIADLVSTAEWAMLLINDYYSWEKEYRASKYRAAGTIANVIAFFM